MTLAQREHPEAVAEFDAAVRWYEEHESGIGLTFIERARQALHDIAEWPSAAPPFTAADDGTVIRGTAVRGFPYRVIYAVESDAIGSRRSLASVPACKIRSIPPVLRDDHV